MNLLYFVLLSFFWGGSYIAIKIVVDFCPPVQGASLRVIVAALCLALVFFFFKKPYSVPKKFRLQAWLVGLFLQGIPFAFLFWGEQYVTPGLAAILICTYPMWTYALSLILFRKEERFELRKFIGLLIGFSGVVIIFMPKLLLPTQGKTLIGIVSIFFVSICYAIGTLLGKHLHKEKEVDRFGSLFQQQLAAVVFLFIATLLYEGSYSFEPVFSSVSVMGALFYLGFFSTAIAWMIFFHLVKEWGAIAATATVYLSPIATLFFDYFLFKNLPTSIEIMGSCAILLGVILIKAPSIKIEFPDIQLSQKTLKPILRLFNF